MEEPAVCEQLPRPGEIETAGMPSGMLFFSSKPSKQESTTYLNSFEKRDKGQMEYAPAAVSLVDNLPLANQSTDGDSRYSDFMLGAAGHLQNYFPETGKRRNDRSASVNEGRPSATMDGQMVSAQQTAENSAFGNATEFAGEEHENEGKMDGEQASGDVASSPPPVIAINTSSLGPGETTTVDGITYNSRGYEVCGQLNQHSKPCQRIGRCPFHHDAKKEAQPKIRRHAVKKSPYKQGWTKEEHLRFLNGLQIHGKGAWKEISNIVGTRTPTQIQSHAQKYYLRQKQQVKNKRSIHDVSLGDLIKEDPTLPDTAQEGKLDTKSLSKSKQTSHTGCPVSRSKGRRVGAQADNSVSTPLRSCTLPPSPSSSPVPGSTMCPPSSSGMAIRNFSPPPHNRTSVGQTLTNRVNSPTMPHFIPPSSASHFRPQPLPSYPSALRPNPNQMNSSLGMPPAASSSFQASSSSNIGQQTRLYQSTMGSYPAAISSPSPSDSNSLLAPMTAFTPFMRPTRTGESGGGYLYPSRPVGAGGEGGNGNTQEDDMVEMELEMLRARGRRLATPPPNTFQPILSLQPHSTVTSTQQSQGTFSPQPYPNVTHLLRPVHSPVPSIPPGSRLPPMSSTPPPSLMTLKHHEQNNPAPSSLAFSFPTSRTMLGNPYTSPMQSMSQATLALLGGTESPTYPPNPSTLATSLSASSSSLSSQSELMKQEREYTLTDTNANANFNTNTSSTSYPHQNEMVSQPTIQTAVVESYQHPQQTHIDFPLLHSSHPGRDSAEPDDPAMQVSAEEHAVQNEGNLSMLSGRSSFSASHDDSEDENIGQSQEKETLDLNALPKRKLPCEDMPLYRDEASSILENETNPSSKRPRLASEEVTDNNEQEEDTASYFS